MSSKETFELATKYIKIKTDGTDSPVSGGVGNFQHHYEYISLNGRKEHNLDFVDNEGYNDLSSSIVLTNYVTVGMPTRPRNESVISTRFSSPGGPETMGKGGRDLESDEYSPYNAMPWRNAAVRIPLSELLTVHQGQFGMHDEVTASFHKIPRNTHYQMAYGSDDAPFTKSVYDNEWVQNSLPFDIGTSSLSYSQETDDHTAAHTGSKANSVLVTQSPTLIVSSSTEISSSKQNLKTIRNTNQFALPKRKIVDNDIGVEQPTKFAYETPLHTSYPILSKVKLNDKTIVDIKNTANFDTFKNEELKTAYSKDTKKVEKSLIANTEQYDATHEYTFSIYPKAQYQFSNDSKERLNWLFDIYKEKREDRQLVDGVSIFGEHFDVGSIWPLDSDTFSGTLMNYSSSIKYVAAVPATSGTWDKWRTPESSSIPYPDSESEFSYLSRKMGENFSLVPEYTISQHMQQYSANGLNWFSSVSGAYTISGSIFGGDSTSQEFKQKFLYSDLCNLVTEFGIPKKFMLVGSVVKQFKPQKECYPAIRSLEIARIFSSSLPSEQFEMRPALNAFFGPGILYNSIKAGIALHYPILTSSALAGGIGNNAMLNIPFEAIRNPYPWISEQTIAHPEEPIFSTYSGTILPNKQYINSIDNFLDDTTNFFMQNKNRQYFASNKQSEYKVAESGSFYSMMITLENPYGEQFDGLEDKPSSIYSEWSSFGPSYQYETGTAPFELIYDFNPYIPPYTEFRYEPYRSLGSTFNKINVLFYATENKKYTISEIIANSYFTMVATTGTMLGAVTPLKESMQNVSSSFLVEDIKKFITDGTEDLTWNIDSIWECPILDYKDSFVNFSIFPFGGPIKYRKGTWHVYGSIPDESNGLFLSIEDFGYKSLADLVGFKKEKKRVGEISQNRKCPELMVMVPLYRGEVIQFEENESNIKRNKDFFKKFLFPPELDYVNNLNVKPYILYCKEVSVELGREDLSRIWQNVLPEISNSPEEEIFEILEENPTVLSNLSENQIMWMIYKVKERGVTNQNGQYGYNWPYDYYSIIELAKIDIKAEY